MSTHTKRLPLEEIEKFLRSHRIDELLYAEETDYFEYKEYSYSLTKLTEEEKEKQKWEMIKDITSIANTQGGILCIGFKTAKKVNEHIEYINGITPVNKEDIKIDSWLDLLEQRAVPSFINQYIEYYGYAGNKEEIFWLKIKSATEVGCFPFLLEVGNETEDKDSRKIIKFSLYQRKNFRPYSLKIEDVQRYISSGIYSEKASTQTVEDRLTLVESRLNRYEAKMNATQEETYTSISRKNNENVHVIHKDTMLYAQTKIRHPSGFFYIDAIPLTNVILENFWNDNEHGIKHLLVNSPQIRSTSFGWDLRAWYTELPYVRNKGWEIMNGDRKLVRVNQTGQVFAGAIIDEYFNWNTKSTPNEYMLRPLALSEFTGNYFKLLHAIMKIYISLKEYKIIAGFNVLRSIKYKLIPEDYMSYRTSDNLDTRYFEITVNSSMQANEMAGILLEEIYASGFNLTEQTKQIYLQYIEGKPVLDEEQIRKIK